MAKKEHILLEVGRYLENVLLSSKHFFPLVEDEILYTGLELCFIYSYILLMRSLQINDTSLHFCGPDSPVNK